MPMPILMLLQEHSAHNLNFWESLVQSNIFNFILAVILLAWIFKKVNLVGSLDSKTASVTHELQEAERKRDQALAELQVIEARAAKLDDEVAGIVREAETTASQVADMIVSQARIEANKIRDGAQKRIAQDEKSAARDLEHRLMREALYSATQMLENTLTTEDKVQSVESFIESLPELAQGGSR